MRTQTILKPAARRPSKFLAELPKHAWSVLDVWTLPTGLQNETEEVHAQTIRAFSQDHDVSTARPGSLGVRAPISHLEEFVACAALSLFFVLPVLSIIGFLYALLKWSGDVRSVAAAAAMVGGLAWMPDARGPGGDPNFENARLFLDTSSAS